MSELLLTATLAGTRVALDAARVQAVIEIETLVPVPHGPRGVAGLTALRSRAMTVVDCAAIVGEAEGGVATGTGAAVIHEGGHAYALALGEIDDVVEARSEPGPVPGGLPAGWADAALGLVETDGAPALLLDPQLLLPMAPVGGL